MDAFQQPSSSRWRGFSFDTPPAIGYTAKPQTRLITMKEEKLSTWWRKCRVTTCGLFPDRFEVQWWYIWFPIWLEYRSNTHGTIEEAQAYAKARANKFKIEL